MKNLVLAFLLALPVSALTGPALAQAAPDRGKAQPAPPGPPKIPDAPQLPYHFGARPAAPNGEKFGNIAAVGLMPNGDLLVFNRNPAIMMVEYDPSGTTVKRVFAPNIAVSPHGMRIDRHGNIWAIDSFMNVIYKMNVKGEVLKMFGTYGENSPWDEARWNGMFNQPLDIAFDKDDNFYVVQSHGGTSPPIDCTFCVTYATGPARLKSVPVMHPPVPSGEDPRVMKFDKDGHLLASASLAHPDGLYPVIHTVIVSPTGEVWVGDRASQKIWIFDKDLKSHHDIQLQNLTSGFYEDAKGQLWMSTGQDGMVMKMGWDGKIEGWIGKRGTNPDSNDIGEGHFLAVTPDQKTIWVADSVNAHVLKLEHN